jgi:hypothetical protein
MLRALPSRLVALATLATFLLAQPAVGCAALCLFQEHHTAAHTMPDVNQGKPTLGNGACHTIDTGTGQRDPLQVLSPMVPADAPVLVVAPARQVEPVRTLPIPPRPISRTVDPPPPRLV